MGIVCPEGVELCWLPLVINGASVSSRARRPRLPECLAEPARKRPYRSKQERREIVEETLLPGASVAVVARRHGVNANQVFQWRQLYREGRLDVQPPQRNSEIVVAKRGMPAATCEEHRWHLIASSARSRVRKRGYDIGADPGKDIAIELRIRHLGRTTSRCRAYLRLGRRTECRSVQGCPAKLVHRQPRQSSHGSRVRNVAQLPRERVG